MESIQARIRAAVEKAYSGEKKIAWYEVFAGEKAFNVYGEWLPADTLTAIREYIVAIKGPLTTPIGGGIRSLNVALRQELDLYVCLRPVRYFNGVPSPVKRPELVDMVIFRENTEDIYAGIEYQEGSEEVKKVLLSCKMKWASTKSVSLKHPVSESSRYPQRAPSVWHVQRLICIEAQSQIADTSAQRKHHEVHGRCLQKLGLRSG